MDRIQTPATVALPTRLVLNFDSYGTCWGTSTVADTIKDIETAAVFGQQIDEWQAPDRTGQMLRIVRITDPTFLDDILVTPLATDSDPDIDEALRRVRAPRPAVTA
ncbi:MULTISPECIES: hypothetical protein [Streptomyces]|uniref:hypothetical protein n=1 Tax=Streptomyces TaxID=1883 RepID=UPI000805CE34|nr:MULTISPECIES: hypothetical protein [Streptomyces]MCW8221226.1 hypothetical protein [Streptomyces griseolus]MYR76557.1 hypothetical protein [Streptomyces sp. SID4925]SBV00071.1 hypothetical protein YUMDRAFT_06326 [Streptomyces sp. OspMP-M45]